MGVAELGVHALDALASGLLLYLVAAGLTLVLRTSRFLNLAQAGFAAAGAAASVAVYRLTGSTLVGVVLACVAFVPVAMAAEILIVRPFQGKALPAQAVAAFGMFLILGDAASLMAEGNQARLPAPEWLNFTVYFPGDFSYPAARLAVIAAGVAGAAGLIYFSRLTRLGARMRALADDVEMAEALGIDARKSRNAVFALACALAALAGALSMVLLSDGDRPTSGQVLALAIAVVILGGSGSLRGAFLAALLISFVDEFVRDILPGLITDVLPGAAAWGNASAAASVFLLTALVLIVHPPGFFGRGTRWEDDW